MENLLRVVTTMTNGGSHTLLIRTFSIFVNFLFRRSGSSRHELNTRITARPRTWASASRRSCSIGERRPALLLTQPTPSLGEGI